MSIIAGDGLKLTFAKESKKNNQVNRNVSVTGRDCSHTPPTLPTVMIKKRTAKNQSRKRALSEDREDEPSSSSNPEVGSTETETLE